MKEVRILTIEEIAERRLAYIKRLQAENAELTELLLKAKKYKAGYWKQRSLLKAASKEEEE